MNCNPAQKSVVCILQIQIATGGQRECGLKVSGQVLCEAGVIYHPRHLLRTKSWSWAGNIGLQWAGGGGADLRSSSFPSGQMHVGIWSLENHHLIRQPQTSSPNPRTVAGGGHSRDGPRSLRTRKKKNRQFSSFYRVMFQKFVCVSFVWNSTHLPRETALQMDAGHSDPPSNAELTHAVAKIPHTRYENNAGPILELRQNSGL